MQEARLTPALQECCHETSQPRLPEPGAGGLQDPKCTRVLSY